MPDLTHRERQVLMLTLRGLTDREIAQELGLAVQTVKNFRGRAYEALGVQGSRALIRAGVALGIISVTPHIYAGENLTLCGLEVPDPCPSCVRMVS